jgi:hypothetical protein
MNSSRNFHRRWCPKSLVASQVDAARMQQKLSNDPHACVIQQDQTLKTETTNSFLVFERQPLGPWPELA